MMIKIPPLHLYLSVHFWRPVRHDRPHTGFDLLLYLSAVLLDCTANEHIVKWCEIKYSVSVVWNCIIHISLFIAYYCAPCIVFWFEHCSALDTICETNSRRPVALLRHLLYSGSRITMITMRMVRMVIMMMVRRMMMMKVRRMMMMVRRRRMMRENIEMLMIMNMIIIIKI